MQRPTILSRLATAGAAIAGLLLTQQAHALAGMYQQAPAPAAAASAPGSVIQVVAPAKLVATPKAPPGTSENPPATPVKLARAERLKSSGFLSTGFTVRLNWQSAIPGLQFCVAYASAHGLNILGENGGRTYSSERVHCMIADRNGHATDSIAAFDQGTSSNDELLIANVVLIDNKVSTETIQIGQLPEVAEK